MKAHILVLFLVVVGCSSDEPVTPKKVVAEHLYAPHVTTFYNEAKLRGVTLDPITPVVLFTNNTEFEQSCFNGSYVLSTSYFKDGQYTIEISDKLSIHESDGNFEAPVIRELGHLLLNRAYEDKPYITVDGITFSNPMCRCPRNNLSYNNALKQVFDYLFVK